MGFHYTPCADARHSVSARSSRWRRLYAKQHRRFANQFARNPPIKLYCPKSTIAEWQWYACVRVRPVMASRLTLTDDGIVDSLSASGAVIMPNPEHWRYVPWLFFPFNVGCAQGRNPKQALRNLQRARNLAPRPADRQQQVHRMGHCCVLGGVRWPR